MRLANFAVAVLLAAGTGLGAEAPALAAGQAPGHALSAAHPGARLGAAKGRSGAQGGNCPSVGNGGFRPEPEKQARIQAKALAAKMTLGQDLRLMHGVKPRPTPDGSIGATAAIRSLGIPAVNQQDGPAGVGDGVTGVTQLPAPVDLAATWDPGLAECYGKVLGTEERGKGVEETYGPTINIVRVPQWGRAFETFGEDPYLDGQVAAAEVNGIQGQGEMAEVKHFAVYNQETFRNTPADDAIVSERAIQEIYTPAWTDVVDNSGPASVMCAYSTINGQFACQNHLLTGVLDRQLGFQGYVGSDYGATHSTVASANAGMDQEQPGSTYFSAALRQAVRDGQVSRSTINAAVVRILTQMYRFRLFTDYPAGHLSATVTSPADRAEGLAIAEAGTTLLKNATVGSSRVLPYTSTTPSIAVIGGDASAHPKTDGGGSAAVVPSSVVTPLKGIRNAAGKGTTVSYSNGGSIPAAASAAAAARQAVVFVNDTESEAADRSSLKLPGNQDRLIKAVAAANPRTVVVLNTGAPVLMSWLSRVAGVIEAWYPGQDDGTAIAQVLFGHANPSGHLPDSFPVSQARTPVSTPRQFPGVHGKVHYSEGIDVGYRWYDQHNVTPLFPFGYGLSYTTFSYSHLHITPPAISAAGGPGSLAHVTATVTNTGSVAGADVAQLYIGAPHAAGEPPRQLAGFQRVNLAPGQSQQVSFGVAARALSYWSDSANGYVVPDGRFTVQVGDSSAMANLPLRGSLTVTRSAGSQSVRVQAPSVLGQGTITVPVTLTNNSDVTDNSASVGLAISTGGAPLPAADAAGLIGIRGGQGGPPRVSAGTVAPGASVTVRFAVTVPPGAVPGTYQFAGTASYLAAGHPLTTSNTAAATIAFRSVSAAFNGVGTAPAGDPSAGNFDGDGFSFGAQQLGTGGFAPGNAIVAEGQELTLPSAAPAAPDEITAEGQVIDLNQSGSELGFLGAGTFGTQGGPVTVTYTDGTSQTATLSLADWAANSPVSGTVIAASSRWNRPPANSPFRRGRVAPRRGPLHVPLPQEASLGSHPVSVYYAQIPVDPGKTVASVTLPDNPQLRLFDVGVATSVSVAGVPRAGARPWQRSAAGPMLPGVLPATRVATGE